MSTPSPEQAAEALALADRSTARLSKRVIAMRVAVAGLGAGSLASLLILGLVSGIGAVIGSLAMIFGALIALVVVAAPAQGKVREKNFARRYLTMVLAWGVIYGAVVVLGMNFFRDAALFWIVGAVLSAIPAAWFVLSGAKAAR